MENLSSDVVLDILSRLPKTREGIKSSLQCRKVCRLWRNLLGKSKTGTLFAVMSRYDFDIKFYYKAQSSEMQNFKCTEKELDLYEGTIDIKAYDFSLVGSCNGLVCYKTHEYLFRNVLRIVNPITNENIRLPKMDPCCECVGFGYCDSTNVYKVIQICSSGNSKRRVLIYTLGDVRGWRKLKKTSYNFRESGIFASGALYWLSAKSKNVVVAFDLADETFPYIPSPPCHHIPFTSSVEVNLGSLEGNLYMCRRYIKEGECLMDVWIFKNKNMNNCTTRNKGRTYFNSYRWINVLGRKCDSDLKQKCHLLSFTENEILLFQNGVVSCYHPTTFKKIWQSRADQGYILQAIPYMHSLVSLKDLGEEVVDCLSEG